MRDQKNIMSNLGVAALILTIAASMLLSACSIKEPQSPSWSTTWNIPITNKTYDINEILQDIDDFDLVLDSLGNPGFEVSQEFDTISAAGNLTVNGTSVALRDSVGLIDIAAPSNVYATTDVNDVLPVNMGVIPPSSFDYDQPLDTIGSFSWMDV